jgi:hypothetical protein
MQSISTAWLCEERRIPNAVEFLGTIILANSMLGADAGTGLSAAGS